MQNLPEQRRQAAGRAAAIPVQRLAIMMNSGPQGRDSGLVVTRDDIHKIKNYEKSAFALPTSVACLHAEIGVSSTGIDGLEPSDILEVYGRIRQHAGTWMGLESDIKSTSNQLHMFAGKFRRNGNAVLKVIDAMDFMQSLQTTVGERVLEDVSGLCGQPLSKNDIRLKGRLISLLECINQDVANQRAHVERVKVGTAEFARQITRVLITRGGPQNNARQTAQPARNRGEPGRGTQGFRSRY
ncbi:hypothetical protein [Pseudomonas putida]